MSHTSLPDSRRQFGDLSKQSTVSRCPFKLLNSRDCTPASPAAGDSIFPLISFLFLALSAKIKIGGKLHKAKTRRRNNLEVQNRKMQSITFAADFGSLQNQYKVLELSEELLQEIEQGQGECDFPSIHFHSSRD